MPGVSDNNQEISKAVVAVNVENNQDLIQQPRQPTNLQGLLRFAVEAKETDNNSTTEQNLPQLDEDRKKFLESALKSMTVDVIELLQKNIEILLKADNLKTDDDIKSYLEAFEIILEYVDNIDVANDFHKIGGFAIFKPCFNCLQPEIRANACNLLAELSQNNPYCQKVVFDNCLIQQLLELLESDGDSQVTIKALYAISCIVRENMVTFQQFIQYGGLNLLLKVLQRNVDKLRTKTAFLLTALCHMQADVNSRLIYLEYVPVLINLIASERMPSHEHLLLLLLTLIKDNQTAFNECKNTKYKFKESLLKYLEMIEESEDKEQYLEEKQYCTELLHLLFQTNVNNEI